MGRVNKSLQPNKAENIKVGILQSGIAICSVHNLGFVDWMSYQLSARVHNTDSSSQRPRPYLQHAMPLIIHTHWEALIFMARVIARNCIAQMSHPDLHNLIARFMFGTHRRTFLQISICAVDPCIDIRTCGDQATCHSE